MTEHLLYRAVLHCVWGTAPSLQALPLFSQSAPGRSSYFLCSHLSMEVSIRHNGERLAFQWGALCESGRWVNQRQNKDYYWIYKVLSQKISNLKSCLRTQIWTSCVFYETRLTDSSPVAALTMIIGYNYFRKYWKVGRCGRHLMYTSKDCIGLVDCYLN